jgi:hypothetical protein
MRLRRQSLIGVVIVLAILASSCAAKTFHTAALISDQLSQGLLTAQSAVKAANDVGAMTPDTYLALQKRFEQVGVVGLSINQALRDGNSQKAIVQVSAALQVVNAVLEVDLLKVKPEQRAIISIALVAVKSTLLAYASILGGA